MFPLVVDFITLLLSALLVGAMFCVWLVFNPSRLKASDYIILQQQGIRTLHPSMPLLGALTTLVTLASAVLAREDKMRMSLLIATAILFIVSGLITRFANMPINAIVRTWDSEAPPDHWTVLRDTWWRWHCVRLCAGLAGLVLLLIATLASRPSAIQDASMTLFHPLFDALVVTIALLT